MAQGLGRPTQDDAYTESVSAFVKRAPEPADDLVQLAIDALTVAAGPGSELAELWSEADDSEWADATARVLVALRN